MHRVIDSDGRGSTMATAQHGGLGTGSSLVSRSSNIFTVSSLSIPFTSSVAVRGSSGAGATLGDRLSEDASSVTQARPENDTTRSDVGIFVASKALDNPFLDRPPPRKLFKHTHRENSSSSSSSHHHHHHHQAVPNNTTSGLQTTRVAKRESGLILTRVLPSNRSTTTVPTSRPRAESVTSAPCPAEPDVITSPPPAARDGDRSKLLLTKSISQTNGPPPLSPVSSRIIQGQTTTTTPKVPPNMDYFKFLQSAHRHRSSVGGGGGGGGYGSSTEMGRFQSPRKALGTSVMDFARKSIMKHATTQPQTAIKNISRIVTESQGQPSLTDLLTATDANDDDDDDDDDDQDARFERDRDPISRRPSNTEAIHQEGLSRIRREDATSDFEVGQSTVLRQRITQRVPTINEREAFRKSRGLGFRARPVDPKVFTSAGDLGVPRIRKPPLTVPVSPVFSKPRIRATTTTTAPVTQIDTARPRIVRRPVTYPATEMRRVNPTSSILHTAHHQARGSSWSAPPVKASTSYPSFSNNNRKPQDGQLKVVVGFQTGGARRNVIRGPPLRGGESSIQATRPKPSSSDHRAAQSSTTATKKPLTQPVPFKFATDELLRRRGVTHRTIMEPKPESRVDKQTGAVKRPQPSTYQKQLTIPVPFQLATQRRAEFHARSYISKDKAPAVNAAPNNTRRLSRLAGLEPLRSSFQPDGTLASHGKTQLKPTVPISPKFGPGVHTRRGAPPPRFLLKKSTKALTQPVEFRFHQRSKERDHPQQSEKGREPTTTTTDLGVRSFRLSKAQEQKTTRHGGPEGEKTFKPGPIKQYQPITIQRSRKPLTRPVSPMIGEKRKRYQMDLRMNEQQQQQRQVPEQSSSSSVRQEDRSQHPGSHQIHQPIPSDRGRIIPIESGFGREIFVDSKKVSEAQKTSWAAQDHHQQHHQQQQQHLTHQERMQLELANSSHATIHQPPIRLSFPINHEDHIISAAEESDHAPAMPSSAEDSSEYHLSRELRRISLEASRGSGGLYRRKSDAASRIMDRRASGGASGRPSLEGGRVDADNNLEYYPFTRSQAPTNAPNNSSAGISTSVPTKDRDRDVMIASSGMMEIEESNDRRRSGSFIPLDMDHQSFKRTTAPKSSWLTSKPTAESTLNSKSATSTSKPRPKGPVTIDHTLTLSDL